MSNFNDWLEGWFPNGNFDSKRLSDKMIKDLLKNAYDKGYHQGRMDRGAEALRQQDEAQEKLDKILDILDPERYC